MNHLSVTRRFYSAFSVVVFLLGCFYSSAQAQGVGSSRGLPSSSGGNHVIKGRVFFPDDRAKTRMKVRLESAGAFGAIVSVTDEDGQFMFTGLEAGPYTVLVEGDALFETSRERVSIDREDGSPGGRIVDVPLYLKYKPSANPAFASVPPGALVHYNKGMDAVRKADSKKAVEHLSAAVAAHPNFAQAHAEVGVQYLKLAEVEKAVSALQTAVKLSPGDFHPRLNLGIALLNSKNFVDAEEHLVEALKKNSASAVAHMYLGMAFMNQKKLEEAQKELESAVNSKSPEVAIAHKYLGGIYWGQRDYKRAADELEMYLKLVPKAADAERTRAAIKDLRSKQD
jgi:thioredoxin-like negative regulator of GroEL